jgi:hypothetical protein
VGCKFFYGSNYSDERVIDRQREYPDEGILHIKKLLSKASEEWKASLPSGEEGHPPDFTLDIEPENLEGFARIVDKFWDEQGDPVSLYYEYTGERNFVCLCIRETFHHTLRIRWGVDNTWFQLEGLNLQAWDALLKAKCERLHLPWS